MPDDRRHQNEAFLERLMARRPEERQRYEGRLKTLQQEAAVRPRTRLEVRTDGLEGGPLRFDPRSAALETIVHEERPVLFVKEGAIDFDDAEIIGSEARDLVARVQDAKDRLLRLLPLIGRIDLAGLPHPGFIGTGWFVAEDVVVTNRHVAGLVARPEGRRFVFTRGPGGKPHAPTLCTGHEYDDLDPEADRTFAVNEVIHLEEDGPDVAFLRVARRASGGRPRSIEFASSDVALNAPVCVIGYPARAPREVIPDQALMKRVYRDRYNVKRVAPGFGVETRAGRSEHDCTTLGGNSGSVVVDLATGKAVGLHFAGVYKEVNYAVSASVLRRYQQTEWNTKESPPDTRPSEDAPKAESRPDESRPTTSTTTQHVAVGTNGAVSVTIPLTISVSLGSPFVSGQGGVPSPPTGAEEAVFAFWRSRPDGVLGARVGYLDERDRIGNHPCVAASVLPSRVAWFEANGPRAHLGFPVRYVPATAEEQRESAPALESSSTVRYDDESRTSSAFSLDPVEQDMDLLLHVGPEYSWKVLREFLEAPADELVAGMYEFHADHVREEVEARLEAGTQLHLTLDGATFHGTGAGTFDPAATFERWSDAYGGKFRYLVVPEGSTGLVSDAYHIKVAVRDSDTFWLSSGNWKPRSSQPVLGDDDLANATSEDLPGNREWHVVVRNATLARRFRQHLVQDMVRSRELRGEGADEAPNARLEVAVEVIEERTPPSRVLEPKTVKGKVRVRPLLTPDRQGAVYSEAVLELIRAARRSLLFQIPYISMPWNPTARRGYIDDLIDALTTKLIDLEDARVILRSGGKKYTAPAHAAWHFKSKGVDVDRRLRRLDDHHTKGMVVDGQRVLIGSHNWSGSGVTLNRDASLLIDHAEVAGYYQEAFEIDWARARPVKPAQYEEESVLTEATRSKGRPTRAWMADLSDDD